jgi:hypothetical protein
MWVIVQTYYWTETNTNYTVAQDITTTPVMQDFHSPAFLNSDTVRRQEWFPRLDVKTDRTSGAPTPYWWLGATVNLVVVWDADSSFPAVNINEGLGDTRTMGTVSLVPRAMTYDSSFDTVVTWAPEDGGLILEKSRKGLGADLVPQVIGELWGFDNYGVLNNSHSSHVVTHMSIISRVLWSTTAPR